MTKQPAYFDNQAAAAAALNIDINQLREAKRRGCPAFRSGRVYREELLNWLQARDLERRGSLSEYSDHLEENRSVIARTIQGISACANLGVLTPEQYFDFCHTIIEAVNDGELREVFRQTLVNWLQLNFSEIAEAKAQKAHPKIMSWLRAEAKEHSRRDPTSIDLGPIIRSLGEPVKLPIFSDL
jgi:hypothetical protein